MRETIADILVLALGQKEGSMLAAQIREWENDPASARRKLEQSDSVHEVRGAATK